MEILIQIINFLDTHSGSLTFLITAVYVIATILICRANIRAANATREQVEESKRQFEETQRLATMPFLVLEHIPDEFVDSDIELSLPFTKDSSTSCHHSSLFRLKNVGNGTATNIVYTWRCTEKDIREIECFPINAVPINTSYITSFFFIDGDVGNSEFVYPSKAVLELQYNDLLGHTYEQRIIFNFRDAEYDDILEECEVDVPTYQGILAYSLKKE